MDDMADHLPVPVRNRTPARPQALIERGAWLAVALTSRGVAAVRGTFDAPGGTRPRALDLATGALAITTDVMSAAFGVASAVTAELARTLAGRAGPVGRLLEERLTTPVRVAVDAVAQRGQAERRRSESELDLLLDAIVPQVTAAVLDRVDLTAIVLSRVDVDEIAASLDLDAVAARIDVDAIAARLDVEAVLNRLDLDAIASDVLDSIDLPEIIRLSTGSMASETVVDVRLQGIEADEAVNRFVDRILRRRRRNTEALPPADSSTSDAEGASSGPRDGASDG